MLSLTNTLDILERDSAIEIAPLIPESLEHLDLQALQARLRDNPLYEKELISSDLRTTSLLVFLEERSSRGEDQIFRLVAAIRTAAAPLARLGQLYFGGVPEMETAGMRNMIRDLWVFTPITVVLVMVILILNFHSRRGVALPLLAIRTDPGVHPGGHGAGPISTEAHHSGAALAADRQRQRLYDSPPHPLLPVPAPGL